MIEKSDILIYNVGIKIRFKNMINTDKHKLLNLTLALSAFYYIIYTLSFMFASLYLNRFFTENMIAIIFLASFTLGFYASTKLIRKINKYHSFRISSILLSITFISSLVLGINNLNNQSIILIFFSLLIIGLILLLTMINLYVEKFSDIRNTGAIRSINLIINHVAMLFGLISGSMFIYDIQNINYIFMISAIVHLPMFYVLNKYYKHISEPKYKNTNIQTSVKNILNNKNLKGVFVSALGVEGFFTIMNIFLPIYIITILGLKSTLYFAVLLPIAIIPYIILPFFIDEITLKYKNYKAILILGYLIIFLVSATIPFIESNNILVWGFILFFSRIGAATIETINNIYFYKQIHSDDIGSVNLFTNIRSIGYIIGTFIITITFIFTNKTEILFLIFLCCGIYILHQILKIKEME